MRRERYMMRKARISSSRPRPEGPGGLRARSVTPVAMDVFRNKFISGFGAGGQGEGTGEGTASRFRRAAADRGTARSSKSEAVPDSRTRSPVLLVRIGLHY